MRHARSEAKKKRSLSSCVRSADVDTFEFEVNKDGEEMVTVRMLFQMFQQYCKPRKNLIVERHRFLTRNQEQSESIDQYVAELKAPVSDDKLREIKEETEKDETMQALVKIINKGWPSHKGNLSNSLKPLWNYKEQLAVVEGVVFKNGKIVIPLSLRENLLRKIHQSHMGIESKQRARKLVFWPGINEDIVSFVKNCSVCAEWPVEIKYNIFHEKLSGLNEMNGFIFGN